jgi:putative protein kinase ArgK-like GTPase of G3E family
MARTLGRTPPIGEQLSTLLDRFRAGQVPALARAISTVEGQREGFQALLHELLKDGRREVEPGRRRGARVPGA